MTETLIVTSPESVSQAEMDRYFHSASEAIVEQMYEPEFHDLLDRAGIDIETTDPAIYWEKMALYTHQKVTSSELAPAQKETLALVGYLPNFIYNKALLSRHEQLGARSTLSTSEIRNAKRTACAYNNLLKDFVKKHPQSPDHLEASLLESTLQTAGSESRDFSTYAETAIATTIKGIKHEIGFGAILDSLEIPHRDATIDEDLKGQDIVIIFNGQEIGVDIKASLNKVAEINPDTPDLPYAIKNNGDLVMFSMLQDADFGNGFEPSPSQISERADKTRDIIAMAVVGALAKK